MFSLSALRSGTIAAATALALCAAPALAEETDAPMSVREALWSGKVSMSRDDYIAAERYFRMALAAAQTGDEPDKTGTVLNNLALALKYQGRFEEAERLYEEAITLAAAETGINGAVYARRLNNLAELYAEWGLPREARSAYEAALIAMQEAEDADPVELAAMFNNAGGFLKDHGEMNQAAVFYDRSLALLAETAKIENIIVKSHFLVFLYVFY